ncbi:hypothetical protein BJ508DRAFT_410174, partial [Ascobolus immersus RN42]
MSASLETLPNEILYEVFTFLIFMTPNPIDEESPAYPQGYTIKPPPRHKSSEYEPLWALQNVTYRHPLIALLLVNKWMYATVEAFSGHINRSPLFGKVRQTRKELERDRPLSQTFLLIRCIWTQCAYCGKKTSCLGVFLFHLRICPACEEREFAKVRIIEAMKSFGLTEEELNLDNDLLDPNVKPRRGFMKSGRAFKCVFLKEDILDLVEKKKREKLGKSVEENERKARTLRRVDSYDTESASGGD